MCVCVLGRESGEVVGWREAEGERGGGERMKEREREGEDRERGV